MADSLVSIVLDQLHSLEVVIGRDVDEELGKLRGRLVEIRQVLDDAEKKQMKEQAVKLWLEELKDLLYDADDVLDKLHTRFIRSKLEKEVVSVVEANPGFFNKLHSYFFSPYSFSHGIGTRIKNIKKQIDVIAQKKDGMGLIPIIQSDSQREEQRQQERQELEVRRQKEQTELPTISISDMDHVYGLDNDVNVIVSNILDDSGHQEKHIPVISISGTGGVGKTTLAQRVYNHVKMRKFFEQRMWVCVSEPFDIQQVAQAIIEQVTGKKASIIGLELLLEYLSKSIAGKRYLLVLDDIWSHEPWERLRSCLDRGAPGSRVIITTRLENVSEMMGSTFNLHMNPSEEIALSVLADAAFPGKRGELGILERKIAQEVAKKLKGVPLAARLLGSVLRNSPILEWGKLLESYEKYLLEESDIQNSILISYVELPSSMKQCFLFCATFPEDVEIYVDDLIKLWMAQGFLGSSGREDLEEIGKNYFNDLCMCSFFQDFQKDNDGYITSCRMHNLVRDFVQFLTQTECFSLDATNNSCNTQVRHLTTRNMENASIYLAKNLRTLLRPFNFGRPTFTVPVKLFRQLQCLRCLDLSQSAFEELPSKVGSLIHLRFLDLSHTNLLMLPETVTNLCNLQTLRLNHCRSLQKLPDGIGKLSNLRHLEIRRTDDLLFLPQGIARLCSLRTLSKFIVGGESRSCKIGALKPLNYIQGRLKIKGLGQVTDKNEAAEAELKTKRLDQLSLNFGYLRDGDVGRMEGVLENLQPHDQLVELKIKSYLSSQFPSWIGSSSILANLQTLELSRCQNCTKLPALGKLTALKNLTVGEMSSVNIIGDEFYGFDMASSSTAEIIAFPELKVLKFCQMVEWEEWDLSISAGKKVMPNISVITIEDCPKLLIPPLGKLESIKELYISKLQSMKHIGSEFYGISVEDSGDEITAFPKLEKLKVSDMLKLVHWEHPFLVGRKIMPCLCKVTLSDCPQLKALPGFGKLESLESLEINNLPSVKQVGLELLGVTETVGSGELAEQVAIFPKLIELVITNMQEWAEWNLPLLKDTDIMPLLCHLKIENCRKLKGIPFLGRSKLLESLRLIIG